MDDEAWCAYPFLKKRPKIVSLDPEVIALIDAARKVQISDNLLVKEVKDQEADTPAPKPQIEELFSDLLKSLVEADKQMPVGK